MEQIIIQDKYFTLRPVRPEDAGQVHEYASDKSIEMMLNLPNETFLQTKNFVEQSAAEWLREKTSALEFVLEYQGAVMGSIDICFEEDRSTAGMGWVLHRNLRGKGFATRAAALLKELAFTRLGLKSLVAHCDSENKASFRVMKNIGMELVSSDGVRTYARTGKTSGEYMCRIQNHYPPVLKSERLVLRPLSVLDLDAVFKWTGDEEVARYMCYPKYKNPDEGLLWISGLYAEEKMLDYGFVLRETGELVGSGGLYWQKEGGQPLQGDAWGIGYNLRRDQWGKGLATEAMETIVSYARKTYQLKELSGTFAIDNAGSRRVMEKLGMSYFCGTEYSKFDNSESFKAMRYRRVFQIT